MRTLTQPTRIAPVPQGWDHRAFLYQNQSKQTQFTSCIHLAFRVDFLKVLENIV